LLGNKALFPWQITTL